MNATGIDGFVLVHGGYHGAWCWEAVRPLLKWPSVAVDLPGRGARPVPRRAAALEACVAAAIEDADAAGLDRFVLVGHSLGGLTISEVANRHPGRVAHLVYLAALALPPGRTVFDLYYPDGGAPVIDATAEVVPLLDEGTDYHMYAGDLSTEEFAAARARCVPEPLGMFEATVSGYDSGVPATYVRCTRDGAITAGMTDEMLRHLRPAVLHQIDSDHEVMLSHPDLASGLLNDVAERVLRSAGAGRT